MCKEAAPKGTGSGTAHRSQGGTKHRPKSFREQLGHTAQDSLASEKQSENPLSSREEEKNTSGHQAQPYLQAAQRLTERVLKKKRLFVCQTSQKEPDDVAAALAAALAQSGLQMLLVQADILRQPGGSLWEQSDTKEEILKTGQPGLDVISLPCALHSPLAYAGFCRLSERWRDWQGYDGILIQLPALEALMDLPSFLEGEDVLLVVQKGGTRCRSLKGSQERLQKAGVSWMGALFLEK